MVNIGGIANLTVLPGDAAAPHAGFDTGPGNTLLDAWSRRALQQPMDRDGAFAARGRVAHGLLGALLADPYFKKAPAEKHRMRSEYFSRLAWNWSNTSPMAVMPPMPMCRPRAWHLALTAADDHRRHPAMPSAPASRMFLSAAAGRTTRH